MNDKYSVIVEVKNQQMADNVIEIAKACNAKNIQVLKKGGSTIEVDLKYVNPKILEIFGVDLANREDI